MGMDAGHRHQARREGVGIDRAVAPSQLDPALQQGQALRQHLAQPIGRLHLFRIVAHILAQLRDLARPVRLERVERPQKGILPGQHIAALGAFGGLHPRQDD